MATITDARQLGAAVRAERRRRELTQDALAKQAGVSRAWLARFETGHRAASVEQVFLVLRTLGLAFELTAPRMTDAEADLLAALAEHEHGGPLDAVATPASQVIRQHSMDRIASHVKRLAERLDDPEDR